MNPEPLKWIATGLTTVAALLMAADLVVLPINLFGVYRWLIVKRAA